MKRKVKRSTLVTIGILGLSSLFWAQNYKLSEEHRAAMKKLEFLVGKWEGEAWSATANQSKVTMKQTEVVRWALDNSILIVEGLGKRVDPDTQKENIVHEALGILFYDPQAKQYRLNSYVADGRNAIAEAWLTDNAEFIWKVKTPNGYLIRYTVKLNAAGQWTEKGELSSDGESWRQFFGMLLNKVD